ncbi:hypothetical protein, partial [Larsenimonas rhizosphaerae]
GGVQVGLGLVQVLLSLERQGIGVDDHCHDVDSLTLCYGNGGGSPFLVRLFSPLVKLSTQVIFALVQE